MTQEELNEQIEALQKQLVDYQLQLEIFSQREDLGEDSVAAEFENIVKQVETLTEELTKLIENI